MESSKVSPNLNSNQDYAVMEAPTSEKKTKKRNHIQKTVRVKKDLKVKSFVKYEGKSFRHSH